MKRTVAFQFTMCTFAIMVFMWGICVLCGRLGLALNSQRLLYLPYILGGWSPTIASYIVLKKNGRVTGLVDWLKHIFTVKQPVGMYLLVVLLCSLYFGAQILVSGLQKINPLYLILVLTPLMLFGGGLEEAGWRYILQPELDRKLGFVLSSLIVAVIWALWHLPLFFIPGTAQCGTSYLLFVVNLFGLTFALGAVRKLSGSVFLCVLLHCLVNACSGVFIVKQSLAGSAVMSVTLIGVSIVLVVGYSARKKAKLCTV